MLFCKKFDIPNIGIVIASKKGLYQPLILVYLNPNGEDL